LADFCKLQLLIQEIIGDAPAKLFFIVFPGFEKSSERMAPPLEVIITLEYSLTWCKSISAYLSCQGKIKEKITGMPEAGDRVEAGAKREDGSYGRGRILKQRRAESHPVSQVPTDEIGERRDGMGDSNDKLSVL
jgi:hypothetical protein